MSRVTNLPKYLQAFFFVLIVIVACSFGSCKSAPGVKMGGVYENPGSDANHYLRFYDDGSVITVASTGTPQQIAKWFDKNFNDISKGQYTITGTQIKFSSTSSHGEVDYEGEIKGDIVTLKSHSIVTNATSTDNYKFVEN